MLAYGRRVFRIAASGFAMTTGYPLGLAGFLLLGVSNSLLAAPDPETKKPEAAETTAENTPIPGSPAEKLVHVPVTNLFPTAIPVHPNIENPVANDPQARKRGMTYFNQFNCIGCHAPNGGGGMGPSLSNSTFIYGSEPENIYLTILQGRPKGMPAWGNILPDHVIWDLVTYISGISKKPSGPWGKTTSVSGFKIEQIPAEFMSTVSPWKHTAPFSYGQAPFEKVKGSPPLEAPKKTK